MSDYDVIVIGAGHAGIEAALAAARLGCSVLVVTQNPDKIGAMSCNPAIGGLAKGNLVREVDALGGSMARFIDASMIQYRVLNRSRGPAVQGPRAQADKAAYAAAARRTLENENNVSVMMDTVVELGVWNEEGGIKRVSGVKTARGHEITAKAVVLCAGTFLEGKIFIGEYDAREGRLGEEAALGLGAQLRSLGFPVGRLKTGTPARVDGRTVDFDACEKEDGEEFQCFSFDNAGGVAGGGSPAGGVGVNTSGRPGGASRGIGAGGGTPPSQNVPCYITYTNERTHGIIRENIHRSPLFSGKIVGTGPRYCPSIEDKVMRFPERASHHLFIEPEGLYTNEVYLNGMSSSLPEDVQAAFIRSIRGLERARIVRPAYAVEYDYIDPLDVFPSLESKRLAGLFTAGQTNGSSGYEEAAAQGIIAGINAALSIAGEPPLILSRAEAYIGVLIDDLTTLGTKEPYRMFTSRAEYRLRLRHDSADRRLTPRAREIGLMLPGALIDDERWERFQEKLRTIDAVKDLMRRQQKTPPLPADWLETASLDIKYEGYLRKEDRLAERAAKMDAIKLPATLDYRAITGLSAESREKLLAVRPLTIGQASRVSGIRQSDIALLMVLARRGLWSLR